MVTRVAVLACLVVGAAGCDGGATEILVEVRSDLLIPDQIDRIEITAVDPDNTRTQRATATLGPDRLPLPRTLGIVHTEGPLSPYRVTIVGQRSGADVIRREGELAFVEGEIRVWRVDLLASCLGTACPDGETCDSGGCRPVAVGLDELDPWDGVVPPRDAGPYDACVPDERCNGVDDDCDGELDEGFDLTSDPMHCGRCQNACAASRATTTCESSTCVITGCDAGWADCDGAVANGCEAELATDAEHCGACPNACGPPTRVCCAGTCARDC